MHGTAREGTPRGTEKQALQPNLQSQNPTGEQSSICGYFLLVNTLPRNQVSDSPSPSNWLENRPPGFQCPQQETSHGQSTQKNSRPQRYHHGKFRMFPNRGIHIRQAILQTVLCPLRLLLDPILYLISHLRDRTDLGRTIQLGRNLHTCCTDFHILNLVEFLVQFQFVP